jgi:hypothetical protein
VLYLSEDKGYEGDWKVREPTKEYWRANIIYDQGNNATSGLGSFVKTFYGKNGEWQERGDLKVFGYWVGNQEAKQFIKTGVGSTWAEALEQAFLFHERDGK